LRAEAVTGALKATTPLKAQANASAIARIASERLLAIVLVELQVLLLAGLLVMEWVGE
jgi:hypothetical protein